MSTVASTLIDLAEAILVDSTNIRWSAASHLAWLNAGQREAAIVKPDVCVQTKSVPLAAGARQLLGSLTGTTDATMLLQVHCNMGTTPGTTAGEAIQIISREQLDAVAPGWRAETATAAVESYSYDPRNPLQFYVYPPNLGTGFVELSYSAVPAAVATAGDNITINDLYAYCLVDYMLYRAFSMDAEHAANAARAVAHYQAFLSALGASTQVQAANNQNIEILPLNPSVPAGAK
jgi:hypothetical protein